MIIDRAIYRDGQRTAEPVELAQMDDAGQAGGGLAWVGLSRPTEQEFTAVADEFGLHELAVEHASAPEADPSRAGLVCRPLGLGRGDDFAGGVGEGIGGGVFMAGDGEGDLLQGS